MASLNYIDFIIIIIFLTAAIMGAWKGLVRQLFGLAALLLGAYCAYMFSDFAGSYIARWIHASETTVTIIAFALTFLAVLIGILLTGRLVEKLFKITTLGWVNRILGIIFSIIKIAFVLSICIYLLQALDHLWPFFPYKDCENSRLFAPVAKLAPMIFPYLKDWIS